MAVGDENGSVTLLKLSEALSHVSTISVFSSNSFFMVFINVFSVTKGREVGMQCIV